MNSFNLTFLNSQARMKTIIKRTVWASISTIQLFISHQFLISIECKEDFTRDGFIING